MQQNSSSNLNEKSGFERLHSASLNDKQFEKLSLFIHEECGIKIPPTKKTMLEVRLRKRLRTLGIPNFDEYVKFLFSDSGMNDEIVHMIDVVTTNKTDFFREPKQFPFLTDYALPEIIKAYKVGNGRKLKVWSAGCSTGEEPYTLAIVLNEFAENTETRNFDYSILATDISTEVLNKAAMAIYDMERVEPIPFELKKKYLLRSKDPQKKVVRIVPELRKKVEFARVNFMDYNLGLKEKVDVIFCRNVIIYFDKETQERIIRKLTDNLNSGGYLFLGHSETLFSMSLPLTQLAPSIYKKTL
jgi:chemotaxis protein methyltransferase CheR